MFKNAIVAALILGLCGAASATAKTTTLSAARVKNAYLTAITNNTYTAGYTKLSGKALTEFKSQKKQGGGEYIPQVISLAGKGKIATQTRAIYTTIEEESLLTFVKLNKKGGASTVIGNYAYGD